MILQVTLDNKNLNYYILININVNSYWNKCYEKIKNKIIGISPLCITTFDYILFLI